MRDLARAISLKSPIWGRIRITLTSAGRIRGANDDTVSYHPIKTGRLEDENHEIGRRDTNSDACGRRCRMVRHFTNARSYDCTRRYYSARLPSAQGLIQLP